MAEITLTKENFQQEVLEAKEPVLVDFWASWCGPCKMLAPVIEAIAAAHAGTLKVGKVNVDEEGELAMQYQVSSIPTVMLFRDGKLQDSTVGFRTQEELERVFHLN